MGPAIGARRVNKAFSLALKLAPTSASQVQPTRALLRLSMLLFLPNVVVGRPAGWLAGYWLTHGSQRKSSRNNDKRTAAARPESLCFTIINIESLSLHTVGLAFSARARPELGLAGWKY